MVLKKYLVAVFVFTLSVPAFAGPETIDSLLRTPETYQQLLFSFLDPQSRITASKVCRKWKTLTLAQRIEDEKNRIEKAHGGLASSALIAAVSGNDEKAVRFLIHNNPEVACDGFQQIMRVIDYSGPFPVLMKKMQVARLFLQRGPKLVLARHYLQGNLLLSALVAQQELAKILIDRFTVEEIYIPSSTKGDTPLHEMARQGNTELIAYLIKQGKLPISEITRKNKYELPDMMRVSRMPNGPALAQQMIARGELGRTPLEVARLDGQTEVAELFEEILRDGGKETSPCVLQ